MERDSCNPPTHTHMFVYIRSVSVLVWSSYCSCTLHGCVIPRGERGDDQFDVCSHRLEGSKKSHPKLPCFSDPDHFGLVISASPSGWKAKCCHRKRRDQKFHAQMQWRMKPFRCIICIYLQQTSWHHEMVSPCQETEKLFAHRHSSGAVRLLSCLHDLAWFLSQLPEAFSDVEEISQTLASSAALQLSLGNQGMPCPFYNRTIPNIYLISSFWYMYSTSELVWACFIAQFAQSFNMNQQPRFTESSQSLRLQRCHVAMSPLPWPIHSIHRRLLVRSARWDGQWRRFRLAQTLGGRIRFLYRYRWMSSPSKPPWICWKGQVRSWTSSQKIWWHGQLINQRQQSPRVHRSSAIVACPRHRKSVSRRSASIWGRWSQISGAKASLSCYMSSAKPLGGGKIFPSTSHHLLHGYLLHLVPSQRATHPAVSWHLRGSKSCKNSRRETCGCRRKAYGRLWKRPRSTSRPSRLRKPMTSSTWKGMAMAEAIPRALRNGENVRIVTTSAGVPSAMQWPDQIYRE